MPLLDNFVWCVVTGLCILLARYYFIFRQRRTSSPTVPVSETSLKSLNDTFIREYKLARADILNHKLEPMIILKGDSLLLHHNGKRIEDKNAILPIYHDLKSVAHIPLTVYTLIHNTMRQPEHLSALKNFLAELEIIQAKLTKLFPEPKQFKVQQEIVTKSMEMLARVIETPNFSDHNNELYPLFRTFKAAFLSNINVVAQSQLNSMHAIVSRWLAEYQIQVSQLRVMIIGGRGERRDNLPATYFEHLLGENGYRRIVYVEELVDDEAKAKDIFASWFFNEDISRVFFGDDDIERLNKDVLMNEKTREYVKQIFS